MSKGSSREWSATDAEDVSLSVSRDERCRDWLRPSLSADAGEGQAVVPAKPVTSSRGCESAGDELRNRFSEVNLAQNGDRTNVNVLGSGPLSYHATRLEKSRSHRARF